MEAKDYELANYQKLEIAGISGAYTDLPVSNVPEGYHRYGVQFLGSAGGATLTRRISPKHGVFICQEEMNLGFWGKKRYLGEEVNLSENGLDYDAFFGRRRPIDYQIQDAEQRRDLLAAEGQSVSKEKELG